ncbi:MAG: signal recognition particle-docking protein FtsY [Desulfobacterales bacterium]|jgi:fused signal recognition particle receptor|nr:signal recognition particle-docking protein FtsY [Desulfobacterales bacterium]
MWGFFEKLKKGLSKTHQGFVEKIDRLFLGKKMIDQDLLDELEGLLFEADLGVKTSSQLIEGVQQGLKRGELQEPDKLKEFIKQEILRILKSGEKPLSINFSQTKPFVFMVVGVNGGGKTTTIGKIAYQYSSQGKKILIGAADTFRAAAVEQLEIWAKRAGADLIKQSKGTDPSAVAFDSIHAAKARNIDLVFIDTAGRLHTKVNLMEELKKVKRIIGRECPGAPHEILLVLDATTGQNAISQAKFFNEAIGVTGIALTKLDGTAKGGIIVGITEELSIPIRYVGVGEGIDDLREFNASEFVQALF